MDHMTRTHRLLVPAAALCAIVAVGLTGAAPAWAEANFEKWKKHHQHLIDAVVVEVNRSDTAALGVDWHKLVLDGVGVMRTYQVDVSKVLSKPGVESVIDVDAALAALNVQLLARQQSLIRALDSRSQQVILQEPSLTAHAGTRAQVVVGLFRDFTPFVRRAAR